MAAIVNCAILTSAILHKKTSLIHCDSTWWWEPSWILPCWIQTLPSWIQTPWFTQKQSHSTLTLTQTNSIWLTRWWLPSWICHLGFSHFAQKNFTHSFWLNLMMAAILNSAMLDSDNAILDSDTLLSSLRFTQKHSHSNLTLIQTNKIWL